MWKHIKSRKTKLIFIQPNFFNKLINNFSTTLQSRRHKQMINKNHIFLHTYIFAMQFIIKISLPIPISGQSRVSRFSTSPLGPKNLPQDVKLSLSIAGPDTSDSWPLLRDPAAFSSIYPLLTGSSSFSCSCSSSRPLPRTFSRCTARIVR